MQQYTWFYSLSQPLSQAEEGALQRAFDQFTAQWQSHGTPVDGLIRIRHSQFVIIQSNPAEGRPSGCSIDSLKRAVGQIIQQHNLQAVDASQVFYQNDNAEVNSTDFRQIPALIQEGTLGPDTKVFDHTLSQSDDLNKWIAPLKQTWLKRYLA